MLWGQKLGLQDIRWERASAHFNRHYHQPHPGESTQHEMEALPGIEPGLQV